MMAGADGAPTVAATHNQKLVGLVAFALGGVLLFAAFDGWSAWLTDGSAALVVVFVLAAVWRPYLECVESAFRQVFDRLGLHHFYLGNRPRGLWYLAFFWTGIPVVLGWIDLVRLVVAAPATT